MSFETVWGLFNSNGILFILLKIKYNILAFVIAILLLINIKQVFAMLWALANKVIFHFVYVFNI